MKCATQRCRRVAYKTRAGVQTKYCTACRAKHQKESNPFGYHFNLFRCNAKRRGKDFELTIDEYKAFAVQHGLFTADGVKLSNLSIDRIDPNIGYRADNLQVLTIGENSRKRFVDYYRNQELDAHAQAKWEEYEAALNKDIATRRGTFDNIDTTQPAPF